jgi:hypothetical protein
VSLKQVGAPLKIFIYTMAQSDAKAAGHALGARNCCSELPLLFAFFVHSIARLFIYKLRECVCLPSIHTTQHTRINVRCVCLDYKRLISTRAHLFILHTESVFLRARVRSHSHNILKNNFRVL